MPQTMFERCGGFASVRKIVSAFYDRILDCPELQDYFAATNMSRLVDHQTKFIIQVMGGPASFSDEALQRVHAPYAITQAHYVRMVEILGETLEDFDMSREDIEHVRREVMRRAPFIVGRRL